MSDESSPLYGIDRDIFDKFIDLLMNKFRLVDEANYLLEHYDGISGANVAITNQRDVISHFITLLKSENPSREEQIKQLAGAEEHIRRAIVEIHTIRIDHISKAVFTLREKYIETVLPMKSHRMILKHMELTQINTRLKSISELRNSGRVAKRINDWNKDFEDGIKALCEAHAKLKLLEEEMQMHISSAQQIIIEQKNKNRYVIGVALAIVGIAISIALSKLI